ncbi:hypothetical protein D6810_03030 [Candidatus Dojkabacteria bacterium]|uniref:YjeF N-terminal domain-containing protein n=1 Tax=Candidatus Dojkabacteria bacterium TaxID=2099670 RepID=A0A3M0Z3S8_9BACT|nr:MAG: hypothetical protein D6810_03030 [Candidatus Dojkabacteria bacterium]
MEGSTLYKNLEYYKVDLKNLYKEAGEKLAEKIMNTFKNASTFTFVLGLGGNATDGIHTAISLSKRETYRIKIYLIGRQNLVENEILSECIRQVKTIPNIEFYNDCYARDVKQSEVNIEALVGTGLNGKKLNKRFYDVIRRISHFQNPIVAIDVPAPHYTPDFTFSINYPKTQHAEVINLSINPDTLNLIGPGDLDEIWIPNSYTHKNKNGKILWIGTSGDDFEMLKTLSEDYHVEAKGYLLQREERNIEITALQQKLDFLNDMEWSDHIIIDIEKQDLEYLTINLLGCILKNYSHKSTIPYALFTKEYSAKIIFTDKSTPTSCLQTYQESNAEVMIYFGIQTRVYYGSEFRYSNVNLRFNKKLQKILIYQTSVYCTKNKPWSAVRASLFQIQESIKSTKT